MKKNYEIVEIRVKLFDKNEEVIMASGENMFVGEGANIGSVGEIGEVWGN